MRMDINVRVEFDPAPIRHLAVQCPYCNKWFRGYDIADGELRYSYQLRFANYHCPLCNKDFSEYKPNRDPFDEKMVLKIEEAPYEDIYKDCLTKKTTWE